ncbi:ComEC/Rec2 family competence protein [Taklimakanibacter lacteus]|uniref:ComEC/Rec2 family competence protein n=1 Tax=Taklimakanibacter lacteus TaxID=2268456 RepID=UPI000E663BAB
MVDGVQDFAVLDGGRRAGWRRRAKDILAVQAGTFFLWAPVWLMAGIWTYFALPREPPLLAFAIIAVILMLLAGMLRRRRSVPGKILLMLLVGFSLAKIRTEWVAPSTLRAATGEAVLTGVVEDFEAKGPRRAVAVIRITGLEGKGVTRIPSRARITVSGAAPLRLGQIIKARAQLFPLSPPAVPGGYDYGRSLWFEGIGATGRIYGDISDEGMDPSLALRLRAALEELRQAIGVRIRAVMPRERSGFAEALITGERGTIPHAVNDSLQTSGLAHILSISGLHMSLVAGGVFWLARALLALSTTLATLHPIKKWAALVGLTAGFAYMLLASASVATQRSFIMLAVMFIAILVDRPALSMRNLAIAALVILIAFPETALGASLQMSFLAVMGLLAFHEAWSGWRARHEGASHGFIGRIAGAMSRSVVAAGCTTLAAGGFSSIAAAYHFGRLAPYSLIANLLALPVMSFIVMPMAAISVLLMPFGLEAYPLRALDEGLALIQAISDWTSGLPQARGLIPALPLPAALLLTLAAVILCLFRGVLRLLALPVAAVALVMAATAERPDLYVERAAKNVAVRTDRDELAVAHPRRGRFAAAIWLRMEGDGMTPAEASRRAGWACAEAVCRISVKGRRILYLTDERAAMTIPCAEADILIAAFPLRGRCRSVPLRIDRFTVWRSGAQALYLDDDGIRLATSRDEQGERPWVIVPEPRRKDTSR